MVFIHFVGITILEVVAIKINRWNIIMFTFKRAKIFVFYKFGIEIVFLIIGITVFQLTPLWSWFYKMTEFAWIIMIKMLYNIWTFYLHLFWGNRISLTPIEVFQDLLDHLDIFYQNQCEKCDNIFDPSGKIWKHLNRFNFRYTLFRSQMIRKIYQSTLIYCG